MDDMATLPSRAEPTTRGSSSDDGLLVQAARADPCAFGPLYERYRDRVYAYVHTRLASAEDAADLTQQVFMRALEALPQYQPRRGPFAAWLFGIARHMVTDTLRRRHGVVTLDFLPAALQPRMEDDMEATLQRRDALEHLRTFFAALQPDKRELLVLRFTAQLTIAEIASVVGRSEAATQKQLFRLLQTLREQLR